MNETPNTRVTPDTTLNTHTCTHTTHTTQAQSQRDYIAVQRDKHTRKGVQLDFNTVQRDCLLGCVSILQKGVLLNYIIVQRDCLLGSAHSMVVIPFGAGRFIGKADGLKSRFNGICVVVNADCGQ